MNIDSEIAYSLVKMIIISILHLIIKAYERSINPVRVINIRQNWYFPCYESIYINYWIYKYLNMKSKSYLVQERDKLIDLIIRNFLSVQNHFGSPNLFICGNILLRTNGRVHT